MWNIRLVVLVQADYKHKISHVQTSSVKTGIANALGLLWSFEKISDHSRHRESKRNIS